MRCINRYRAIVLVLATCSPTLVVTTCGADWPMWRYDANRSAASPEELPAELHLQWKRELPLPQPAFPEDLRLCADVSYQPVATDGVLFVPSMVADSVTALDAATGADEWEFFADGPVRCAPVARKGKVYFVSDDGHLYCLDASSGRMLWKVRGAPPSHQGRRLLGNGRLVSRWPARGGPVLADGIVYFGAGIWPFEGVFVCAVDAETGELLWRNGRIGLIDEGLIDHGARRDAGLSPLGYLAVVGGKLVVPSGRALPGFLDPQSGQMEPYTTGWGGRVALAKGCWYASGIGGYLFQSGDLYGLTSDAAMPSGTEEPPGLLPPEEFARYADLSPETVNEWIENGRLSAVEQNGRRLVDARKPDKTTYVSLWTLPFRPGEEYCVQSHPRLQIEPANGAELGVFREPVLTTEAMYYSRPINNARGRGGLWPPKLSYSEIVACDLTKPTWGITCQGRIDGTKSLIPWRSLKFAELWTLPTDLKVHIKAGPRLYAGSEGVVAAVDIPGEAGEPTVSWRCEIEGTPSAMLASDGRLFVVTEEGAIYCFGGKAVAARTHRPAERHVDGGQAARMAANILERTGVSEGYGLVLGTDRLGLIEELARQSELSLVALAPDEADADTVRRRLDASGLHAARVHVVPGDLEAAGLPPHFASLAVCPDVQQLNLDAGPEPLRELYDALRPYGGVACFPVSEAGHRRLAGQVAEAKLLGAVLSRADGVTMLRREGSLPGAADWTHEAACAGNTFASKDQLARPPFGMLWFGGDVDRIFPAWDYTHCRGPFPLVCAGRMFILVESKLHAIDIYTGRQLWEVGLEPTEKTKGRRKSHMIWQRPWAENFVAAEDCLYVIDRDACLHLDPETGEQLGEIRIPGDLTEEQLPVWEEVRVWEDCLIGVTGQHLVCMDRNSGEVRWRAEAERNRISFAAGAGKVFCVDHWLPARARRGEPDAGESSVFALDVRSGDELWRADSRTPPDEADEKVRQRFPSLKPHLAYEQTSDVLILTATRSIVAAYRGATGEELWGDEIPCRNPPSNWSGPEPPIVLPNLLVTHAGELYDPRTGSRLADRLWTGMNVGYNEGGTRGCGRAIGNEYVVTLRDADAAYFDLATKSETFLRGVRSGCTNGLIPAGGLLNGPNTAHGCACNWSLFVSFAMVHMPEAEAWRPMTE